MKLPLFTKRGADVHLEPTNFEMPVGWFTVGEMTDLMREEGLTLEHLVMMDGLVTRLMAQYAQHGLARLNPGRHQAVTQALAWMRVLKKKAEIAARKKAATEALRAYTDRQKLASDATTWNGDGLYNPVNGKFYTTRSRMMADAKALGYEAVGNEDLEKAALKTRRETFKAMQPFRRARIEAELNDAMQRTKGMPADALGRGLRC